MKRICTSASLRVDSMVFANWQASNQPERFPQRLSKMRLDENRRVVMAQTYVISSG